jgi:FHS family glucose/mannose:H+ symporter-like MFS transporter
METAAFKSDGIDRRLLASMHAGFILTGITTTMVGPLLPEFSSRWALNDAQAGNLFTAQFLGSMAGVGLSGLLAHRRGYKFPITLGLVTMGFAALALLGNSWMIGLLALFLNGVGLGLVIPSTNLLMASANPHRSSAALNLLNFSWGLGAALCPLLIAQLLRSGGRTLLFFILAAMAGVVAVAFTFTPSSNQQRVISLPDATPTSSANPLQSMLQLGALFFLYLGTESSISGWIASYARRMNVETGTLWIISPAFFWGAILVGRALAPLLLRKFAAIDLARTAMVLSLFGIGILLQATTPIGAVLGATLGGLGLAPVYPITIAMLSQDFGSASSRKSGLLFALAGLGGATVPWIVGVVSTHFASLKVGLLVPLFCDCLVIALYFTRQRTVLAKIP